MFQLSGSTCQLSTCKAGFSGLCGSHQGNRARQIRQLFKSTFRPRPFATHQASVDFAQNLEPRPATVQYIWAAWGE